MTKQQNISSKNDLCTKIITNAQNMYLKEIETNLPYYRSYEEYKIFYPNESNCSLYITTFDDKTYVFYQISSREVLIIERYESLEDEYCKCETVGSIILLNEIRTAIIKNLVLRKNELKYNSDNKIDVIISEKRINNISKNVATKQRIINIVEKFLGDYKVYLRCKNNIQKNINKRLYKLLYKSLDVTIIPRDCYDMIINNIKNELNKNLQKNNNLDMYISKNNKMIDNIYKMVEKTPLVIGKVSSFDR